MDWYTFITCKEKSLIRDKFLTRSHLESGEAHRRHDRNMMFFDMIEKELYQSHTISFSLQELAEVLASCTPSSSSSTAPA